MKHGQWRADLVRWLDEQAAAEERFARRAQAMGSKNGHAGAVLRAQVYRHVKGHVERLSAAERTDG